MINGIAADYPSYSNMCICSDKSICFSADFSSWSSFFSKIKNWIRVALFRYKMKNINESAGRRKRMKRWEADYNLEALDRLHLFDEYIEMGK